MKTQNAASSTVNIPARAEQGPSPLTKREAEAVAAAGSKSTGEEIPARGQCRQ